MITVSCLYYGWLPPLLVGLVFICGSFTAYRFVKFPLQNPMLSYAAVGLISLLLGFSWHVYWARTALDARLPAALEGLDLLVQGSIVGLPRATDFGTQFLFDIEISVAGFTGKVLLNDYAEEVEQVTVGQQREMQIRLKRPHGVVNPGGYDREANMLRRGVVATGYIREVYSSRPAQRLSLTAVRQRLLLRLNRFTEQSEMGGLLVALVLGTGEQISPKQRDLFAETGTSHLFVVSGLHIGLIAGVTFWLAGFCLRPFSALALRLPRQKLAMLASMLAALVYAGLAGFTLPTIRALVMLTVFMGFSIAGRQVPVTLRWFLALAIVLSLDPLAPVSPGFWFSFVAVAALMLVLDGRQNSQAETSNLSGSQAAIGFLAKSRKAGAWILSYLKPQFSVFAALLLPLIILGLPISLLSPLINLFAIPVLGLLLVPLCLLFALVAAYGSPVAEPLFTFVETLLGYFVWALQTVSDSSLGERALLNIDVSDVTLSGWILAGLGLALLLYPVLDKSRWLCLPLMMPLMWPKESLQQPGLQVNVLDVGQGLAVLVRTSEHSLLYDTGNGRDDGFSAGRAIIAPALISMGIRELDRVVISHGDTDHAGGLHGLLAVIPTKSIITNGKLALEFQQPENCVEFEDWVWDGVVFRFLNAYSAGDSSNNNSCVLQVKFAEASLLLAGDIEKEAEYRLLAGYSDELKSELLIAPHHGSKTSSSFPFLKTVKPSQAVFSSGYRNRFNHPALEIRNRYHSLGIKTVVTAQSGMLSFEAGQGFTSRADNQFKSGSGFGEASWYRKAKPRYWRCLKTCR